MGAGQIGGIATMLDFDFNNAAGFLGRPANNLYGQHIVYYLSHAMLFCTGVLIEPHIVLTPAVCVYGERYKFDVYGGSHKFLEGTGTKRTVDNICMHRGYNHSERQCSTDNIALLVLRTQFVFRFREANSDYILNRVRYGVTYDMLVNAAEDKNTEIKCHYYGWGSRRNNEKYGALCPDDVGSVVECGGYVQGMMVSQLVDRPCGVGFLNLALYTKFIECAVDDSRDAMEDSFMSIPSPVTPEVSQVTVPESQSTTPCTENCAPKNTLSTPAPPDFNKIAQDILTSTPPVEMKLKKLRQRF